LVEQARATVRSGEAGQRIHAIDALRRAAAISPKVELRREAMAALALPDLRLDREIRLEEGITHAALDPKFERVAVARSDGAVEIRTIPERRLLATFPAAGPDAVTHAKWSPDGRFLAFRRGAFRSGADRLTQVEVWEVNPGRRVLALPRTPWSAFAFHPSLPRIVSGDTNDAISIWNLETGEMLARFALAGLVLHLEFTFDGARIFAQRRVVWPWLATVLDAATGVVQRSELSAWTDGVALHPHHPQIAFAMRTGEIVLGDAIGSALTVLGRHKSEARSAAFSADGRFLFTGGEEQEIICWDLRTGRRAFSFAAGATRIQLAADGERCAIVAGTRVLLYHFERATLHREFSEDLGGHLRHAAFSPDGRWLAVGGQERLGLWDLSRESPALLLEGGFATPVFSPESTELLAFGGRYHSRGRIVPAGQAGDRPRLTPLPALRPNRILSAHFVTDSLVLGTDDGVHIVPRTDVTAEGVWHRLIGQVSGQVSPNGRWMTWRTSKSLLISSLAPWKSTKPILFESALATAFTPQSDELLVATRTGITFFETVNWKPRRTFSATFDRNARLLPSPDGRSVWFAHDAQTAALHDLRTLEPILPLPRGMVPLAVSLDGRRIAVSVDAQRVQVWDVPALRKALGEMGLDWRDPPD
jgi:WD40 repeat protein